MRAADELSIRLVGDRHPDVIALRAALDAEVARLCARGFHEIPAYNTNVGVDVWMGATRGAW
jgi:hypothetical protein